MHNEAGGYVVAVAGALVGTFVGVGVGHLIGVPVALWALDLVEVQSDASGMDAAMEVLAEGVLAILLAVFAFVVAVVVSVWLAAMVGCGVSLRAFGYRAAQRTALLAGLIGPVAVIALAKLAEAIAGSGPGPRPGGDGDFYFGLVVGVTVSCLAARWLATGPMASRSAQLKSRRMDSV